MTEPTTAFDMLAEHLRQVVHALEAGKSDSDGRPLPGSPAARENEDESLHGEWGQTPALDANNLGRLLCISASDHVLSLADALESPITGAFVSFTIGRGVLEAAGRAWYLTDPAIDLRERARRYMNEKLWSINESRRFLNGLQSDTGKLDEVEDAIRRTAETKSYSVGRTGGNPRSEWHLDDKRPSVMAVCDLILPARPGKPEFGSATYRFLSASAHGGEAGLAGHLEHGDDAQITVVKKPESHARYLFWPVKAYVSMGDRFLHHYGWDNTLWDQARDATLGFWVQQAAQGLQMPQS
jgi:hypothetical protein